MIYDFIVVGHGLAGAILAETLRSRGNKVLVIDEPKANSASRVAAGLLNPVAGKRFAKSWLADTLVPAADAFYDALEVNDSAVLGDETLRLIAQEMVRGTVHSAL